VNTKALFSSGKDDWETPQSFFDELDREFHFTLDPCATAENSKCTRFFTETDDGLLQSWGGETVFCNPPYGRDSTGKWMKKAYEESQKPMTTVVCLVPARTDTKWFHDYVLGKAEIRFVKGRLKFGGSGQSAPFPSMIVVYGSESGRHCRR
jgi:site-specific DNA-methyltransferase (adenine-specific)